MRGRGRRMNTTWWTQERVLKGMRRFYEDFGYCPTDQGAYARHAQFTGIDPVTGKHSNLGWHQKYPSANTILRHFATLREAWEAAGFEVNHSNLEWKPIEDWFIIESCGILPREEVAQMLKRSAPAVKRRLYDLGRFTAKTRWGITLSGAAHLLGVAEGIVRRYLDHGVIPFFRGYKLIYLNPADLTKIEEVNWNDIHPDAESLIWKALVLRALKIIKYRDAWRDHEIYKFLPKESLYKSRIKNRRVPVSLKAPLPERPNDLAPGDWIKMAETNALGLAGRYGKVLAVHYSPQVCNRRDGSYRACWLARVEFPRLRRTKVAHDDRIRYTLPLDCLKRADPPEVEERPLSMHPEAIRGRARKQKGEFGRRARVNFELLEGHLT
jgi:hypothetical protein